MIRVRRNAVKVADRKDWIEQRTIAEAEHILEYNCTIRETAAVFGVSKSTTHNDLKNRLPHLNAELDRKVKVLMAENWNSRYIRGGESTRINAELDRKVKALLGIYGFMKGGERDE